MYEQDEAHFAERYDRYYPKLKKLGVPMQVWKEVLVELYFPVDWRNEPDAFKWLGYELDHLSRFDLTRAQGVSDHEYARGLLMQSQRRLDEQAWIAENMNPDFAKVPPLEEEDDDAILEAHFADREKEKTLTEGVVCVADSVESGVNRRSRKRFM